MKILNIFIFLWVIFALLDPDPDPATQINADPDPDPKPCKEQIINMDPDHLAKLIQVLIRISTCGIYRIHL
jgi:hypothetical protein